MNETAIDSSWYLRPKGVQDRISAGGIIVRLAGGKPLVALAREGDWPLYVLPKGGVEKGETFEQAARREIEEEAGLSRLSLVGYLGQLERLNYARTRWMVVHYFLYRTEQIEGVPTDSQHHHGVWWFDVERLPPMLWPEQHDLIQSNLARIHALSSG